MYGMLRIRKIRNKLLIMVLYSLVFVPVVPGLYFIFKWSLNSRSYNIEEVVKYVARHVKKGDFDIN